MTKDELVDLCRKGDGQALSLLYKTYADRMMKICYHYVSDRQTAQDLLHDGFIIIFASISTLRSADKLEGWMGTIMKNISLQYLKQQNSIGTISLEEIEEDEEPIDLLPSKDFPPYETMLEIIESLPEGYGKVFKLAILEGLSHKEISSLLNIAPHSPSSQLSRAKEMLRKLVSQYRVFIGLFIILSIISVRLFYTPKRTVITEQKIEPKQKAKEAKSEKMPQDDSIKPILKLAPQQYADSESIKSMVEKEVAPEDSIAERKDTIQPTKDEMKEKIDVRKQENIYYNSTHNLLATNKKNWSLALSYSGGEQRTDIQQSLIPGDVSSGQPKELEEKTYHRMPVTVSLSVHKKINEHWGMETGLQYTYLRSDFTAISDFYSEKIQRIHYIGIPFKASYTIWSNRRISLYTSAGVTLDIPVRATSENLLMENERITSQGKTRLSPSLQWSTNFGIGMQYQITPAIGIYAEPNLNYYFNNGNNLNTIRKEQPLNITLPIGIRFSW